MEAVGVTLRGDGSPGLQAGMRRPATAVVVHAAREVLTKTHAGVRGSGIINDRPFTHTLASHCHKRQPSSVSASVGPANGKSRTVKKGRGQRGGGELDSTQANGKAVPGLHPAPLSVTYTASGGKRLPYIDSNTSVTQTITIE